MENRTLETNVRNLESEKSKILEITEELRLKNSTLQNKQKEFLKQVDQLNQQLDTHDESKLVDLKTLKNH